MKLRRGRVELCGAAVLSCDVAYWQCGDSRRIGNARFCEAMAGFGNARLR